MDWQTICVTVWGFLAAAGVPLILGLIALDVALGIAAALRQGRFEWGRVWQFYKTMVLPYLLGYLALQVALALLPGLAAYLPPAVSGLSLVAITGLLVKSIAKNMKGLMQEG